MNAKNITSLYKSIGEWESGLWKTNANKAYIIQKYIREWVEMGKSMNNGTLSVKSHCIAWVYFCSSETQLRELYDLMTIQEKAVLCLSSNSHYPIALLMTQQPMNPLKPPKIHYIKRQWCYISNRNTCSRSFNSWPFKERQMTDQYSQAFIVKCRKINRF